MQRTIYQFSTLNAETCNDFITAAMLMISSVVCGMIAASCEREGYVTSADFIGKDNDDGEESNARLRHYRLLLRYIIRNFLRTKKPNNVVDSGQRVFPDPEKVLGPMSFARFLGLKPEKKKIRVMLDISHELASYLRPYAMTHAYTQVFGGVILYDAGNGTALASCDGDGVGLADPATIKPSSPELLEICKFYAKHNTTDSPVASARCLGSCCRWLPLLDLGNDGICMYCTTDKTFGDDVEMDDLTAHLLGGDASSSQKDFDDSHSLGQFSDAAKLLTDMQNTNADAAKTLPSNDITDKSTEDTISDAAAANSSASAEAIHNNITDGVSGTSGRGGVDSKDVAAGTNSERSHGTFVTCHWCMNPLDDCTCPPGATRELPLPGAPNHPKTRCDVNSTPVNLSILCNNFFILIHYRPLNDHSIPYCHSLLPLQSRRCPWSSSETCSNYVSFYE